MNALSISLMCAALLAGGAGIAVGDEPERSWQERTIERLQARAEEEGSVRLIVGVDAGFVPEGELADGRAVAAQRRRAAAVRRQLLARLAAHPLENVREFATIPFLALTTDALGLAAVLADPAVVSVEEDEAVPPSLADSVPLVGAPGAWEVGATGAGQTVAVLDTGVQRSHPFLRDQIVAEACYSSDTSISSSVCPNGRESQVGTGASQHCPLGVSGCDHGTHVAGIAVGRTGGRRGVAPEASLIAVQVFSRFTSFCSGSGDCARSWTSDQIRGLERVFTLRNRFSIAAANLSLGGSQRFTSPCDAQVPAERAIINNLYSVGIATVVSAGNNGWSDGLSAPACISRTISAGSTTKSDTVSSFSNSAPFLDLLAPGSSIVSSVPGGTYGIKSGTSMAAPHVTGAWAVARSRQPDASVPEVLAALSQTGVRIRDPRNGLRKPRIRLDAAVAELDPGCEQTAPLGSILPGSWTGACAAAHRPGSFARYVTFTLGEPTEVRIDLESAVDTYLVLLDGDSPDGAVLEENDNAGEGETDARIATALAPGTYTIEATTSEAGTTGDFTLVLLGEGDGPCIADGTTLCLLDGRFRVRVSWEDFTGLEGGGQVVTGGASNDSGLYWFFAAANWEMLVKMVDACSLGGRFWLFSAATTNVEYSLEVTDTETGFTRTYANPLGEAAPAVTDTGAFAGCP